jgi:hypothetical protein
MADTPQGNPGFISEMDIRIWLRDTDPEANTLLLDLEFSPEEIRTAQTFAVDRWNETPPFVARYSVATFPWRWNLLRGTVANLLTIAGHRYRRNHLNYNVPGGAINDQDKAPAYDAAAAKLSAEYGQFIHDKKIELNIEGGWGWT